MLERTFDRIIAKCADRLALVVRALGDANDAIRAHKRLGSIGMDHVLHAVLSEPAPASVPAPGDEDGVLEALRRDEANLRSASREDGVVDDGRPVHEERRLAQQRLEGHPH